MQRRIRREVFFDPGKVFGGVGSVNYEEKAGCCAVDKDVIDNAAIRLSQHGILDIAFLQRGRIIRGEFREHSQGTRPFQIKFTHVTKIKETYCPPDSKVFFNDTSILHWHLKSGKVDHFCTKRAVHRGQGSLFQVPSPPF